MKLLWECFLGFFSVSVMFGLLYLVGILSYHGVIDLMLYIAITSMIIIPAGLWIIQKVKERRSL